MFYGDPKPSTTGRAAPSCEAVSVLEPWTFIFIPQNVQTHPCPRHRSSFLEQAFQGQKHYSKGENWPMLKLFPSEHNHFPWSDPPQQSSIPRTCRTNSTSYSITVPFPVFWYSSSTWLTNAILPWELATYPREAHQAVNVSGSISTRRATLPLPLINSHCLPTRAFQSSKLAGIFGDR